MESMLGVLPRGWDGGSVEDVWADMQRRTEQIAHMPRLAPESNELVARVLSPEVHELAALLLAQTAA